MARPPVLDDASILALIEELRGRQAVVTGTRLREELARRHGRRCGVARLYRLLRQATAPSPPPAVPIAAPPSGTASDLQAQLDAALERSRLAERREEHQRLRWASEIHALREQVRTHHEVSHRLRAMESELQSRSRELAAAYRRIADLEALRR